MTIVFPSAVIVALSWSTFFVPANLPTAKLSTALVTALSSLALEVIGRTAIAPVLKEVPYVTVIDIWMTSCLIFVITALVIQLTVVRWAPTQQQVGYRSKLYSVSFAKRKNAVCYNCLPISMVHSSLSGP